MRNSISSPKFSSADLQKAVRAVLQESIAVKQAVLKSQVAATARVAAVMIGSIRKGGRVYFFGNGGSAGDSQHLAGEFLGRFLRERKALPGMALTTDGSTLTAVANDYGFEEVFARQIEGLGRRGDVAVGITTSGNSRNVLRAFKVAKSIGMTTVALTGGKGGQAIGVADHSIVVPSHSTPRIQEAHITIGHALCQLVEAAIGCPDSHGHAD
ncbi:MAG: D-sedoheptulose 7-phosphate isomerase [Candidatus Omnitrophica bacterium]|nr:D-sedoheptulose 7-phosphate isomerase [Candidatus Omnitrophota bacterium]